MIVIVSDSGRCFKCLASTVGTYGLGTWHPAEHCPEALTGHRRDCALSDRRTEVQYIAPTPATTHPTIHSFIQPTTQPRANCRRIQPTMVHRNYGCTPCTDRRIQPRQAAQNPRCPGSMPTYLLIQCTAKPSSSFKAPKGYNPPL